MDGLDTMSRGSLLHKVITAFLGGVPKLVNLKSMLSPEQLNEKINAAIDTSIDALNSEVSYHIPLLLIERSRLSSLMQAWLELVHDGHLVLSGSNASSKLRGHITYLLK